MNSFPSYTETYHSVVGCKEYSHSSHVVDISRAAIANPLYCGSSQLFTENDYSDLVWTNPIQVDGGLNSKIRIQPQKQTIDHKHIKRGVQSFPKPTIDCTVNHESIILLFGSGMGRFSVCMTSL